MDRPLNLPITVGIVIITTVFAIAAIYRYPGGQAPETPPVVQLPEDNAFASTNMAKPKIDESSALPAVEQQVRALGKVVEQLPVATESPVANTAALQARMTQADTIVAKSGIASTPAEANSPAENPRLAELRARLQQLQSQR